jgi:hypothetical protein
MLITAQSKPDQIRDNLQKHKRVITFGGYKMVFVPFADGKPNGTA